MNPIRTFSSLALVLIFMGGCGGDGLPPVYPVTGKVSFSGGSLSGYRVSFVPASGSGGGSAEIKDDGSYTLQAEDGRMGCTAGKYKVTLQPGFDPKAMQEAMKKLPMMKGNTKGLAPPESKLPKTYSAAATSPKEVEVKSGPNTIDISI